jgi:hypothetical protein
LSVLLFFIELSYYHHKRYKMKMNGNRNWKQTHCKAATGCCYGPIF